MRKPRVFVDSSVLVAALLSSTGGSLHVLTTMKDIVDFQISNYTIEELKIVFRKKFKDSDSMLSRLFMLIGLSNIRVLDDPKADIVRRMAKYVPKNDSPILSSALLSSDYLLTLDNGFFVKTVLVFAARHSVRVVKPKDLLEIFTINTGLSLRA